MSAGGRQIEEEFQLNTDDGQELDFVAAGHLTAEQAGTDLDLFFRGCGLYFPFLDSKENSMELLRNGSSLLS